MTKTLWIGTVLIVILINVAAAETLIKKSEGVYITKETTGNIAMEKGQRLIVNAAGTLSGELSLEAGGRDCRIAYIKVLKTPTKVEASEFAGVISVEMESQGNSVVLSLRAPAQAPWSGTGNPGRLDIKVSIPEECAVEFNTAYFDITATGPFTEFIVSESLSKVQVEGVNGLVEVKVSNRPLLIKDVTGKIIAINKYDRLRLENIDTGDNLGMIQNEHGEISIDGYRGELDIRTSYGDIIGQNLFITGSKNRIKNISALINLSFDSLTTGYLRVNNRYERIHLEIKHKVDARFICKGSEKSIISAENMEIIPVLVDQNRLDFDSGEGTAEVRLSARGSGNIEVIGPDRTKITGGR
jgi:hypothetical protein